MPPSHTATLSTPPPHIIPPMGQDHLLAGMLKSAHLSSVHPPRMRLTSRLASPTSSGMSPGRKSGRWIALPIQVNATGRPSGVLLRASGLFDSTARLVRLFVFQNLRLALLAVFQDHAEDFQFQGGDHNHCYPEQDPPVPFHELLLSMSFKSSSGQCELPVSTGLLFALAQSQLAAQVREQQEHQNQAA
jgi:hypothetical protein